VDWLPKTGPLGDFIDPGQARFVIVGESKVEDAIKHVVTRAEKQTAKELDVDPKDVDKALLEGKPCQKLSRICSPADAASVGPV
jgi:hypothetical protein